MTAFIRSSQGYVWGVGGENKVWLAFPGKVWGVVWWGLNHCPHGEATKHPE